MLRFESRSPKTDTRQCTKLFGIADGTICHCPSLCFPTLNCVHPHRPFRPTNNRSWVDPQTRVGRGFGRDRQVGPQICILASAKMGQGEAKQTTVGGKGGHRFFHRLGGFEGGAPGLDRLSAIHPVAPSNRKGSTPDSASDVSCGHAASQRT